MILDLHMKRRKNTTDLTLERDFEALFASDADARSTEVILDIGDEQQLVVSLIAVLKNDAWSVIPNVLAVLGPHLDRVTAPWLDSFMPRYCAGEPTQPFGSVVKNAQSLVMKRCVDAVADLSGYTVYGTVRKGKLVSHKI